MPDYNTSAVSQIPETTSQNHNVDKYLLALLKALEKTFTPISLSMIATHQNNNNALAMIGSMAAVISLKMFFIIPIRHFLPLLKSGSHKTEIYKYSSMACTALQATLNAVAIIFGTNWIVGNDSIGLETKLTLAAAHAIDLCAIYFRLLLIYRRKVANVCLITGISGLAQVLFVGLSILYNDVDINTHMRGILVYAVAKYFGLAGYQVATSTPIEFQQTLTVGRLWKGFCEFYIRSFGLLLQQLLSLTFITQRTRLYTEYKIIDHINYLETWMELLRDMLVKGLALGSQLQISSLFNKGSSPEFVGNLVQNQ